jgi:hypothetical protein
MDGDRDGQIVNHPDHYNQVPNIECIQVVEWFNFNRGNAIKYIWRAGLKGDASVDLKKAIRYLEFELERMNQESGDSLDS